METAMVLRLLILGITLGCNFAHVSVRPGACTDGALTEVQHAVHNEGQEGRHRRHDERWRAPWAGGSEGVGGIYAPLLHEAALAPDYYNKLEEEERSTVRWPKVHTKEYHKAGRARDAARRRGRGLLTPDEILYDVGGRTIGAPGAYYINVSMGARAQPFHVQIDSGSDLFWVPCACLACATQSRYLALNAPYEPAQSGTSAAIKCSSMLCDDLARTYNNYGCSQVAEIDDLNCQYSILYGDASTTRGELISDTLNMAYANGTRVRAPVVFGCGREQGGSLLDNSYGLDGLMGLGQGPLSISNQLKLGGYAGGAFAMCLEGETTGGHLIFGVDSDPPGMQYTPLAGPPNTIFYYLGLESLDVGGEIIDTSAYLSIDQVSGSGGVIVDSGTTFTQLSPPVYSSLKRIIFDVSGLEEFDPREEYFDCLQGAPTTLEGLAKVFPNVTLHFGDATWTLPPSSYLFHLQAALDVQSSELADIVCIGATQLSRGQGPDIIIGETWLRNLYTVYDRANARFGWLPMNCTTGEYFRLPGSRPPRAATAPGPTPGARTNTSDRSPNLIDNNIVGTFRLPVKLAAVRTRMRNLTAALNSNLATTSTQVEIASLQQDVPEGGTLVLFVVFQAPLANSIPQGEMVLLKVAFETLLHSPQRLLLPPAFGTPFNFTAVDFTTDLEPKEELTGPTSIDVLSFLLTQSQANVRRQNRTLEREMERSLRLTPYEGISLFYNTSDTSRTSASSFSSSSPSIFTPAPAAAPSSAARPALTEIPSTTVKVAVVYPPRTSIAPLRRSLVGAAAAHLILEYANLGLDASLFGYVLESKLLLRNFSQVAFARTPPPGRGALGGGAAAGGPPGTAGATGGTFTKGAPPSGRGRGTGATWRRGGGWLATLGLSLALAAALAESRRWF